MNDDTLNTRLERELLAKGVSLVGFADVANYSGLPTPGLTKAVVVGLAYCSLQVKNLATDVHAFERYLKENRRQIAMLLQHCERILGDENWITYTPPIAKNLPGLVGELSHKHAAVRAGLGWIGKNSLFVSKKYGCALRLATVLTDAPLVCGTPVEHSSCGSCKACVEACPYGAIKGNNWTDGMSRDELVDVELCSRKREEYMAVGRFKHPCGLCLQACPYSQKAAACPPTCPPKL